MAENDNPAAGTEAQSEQGEHRPSFTLQKVYVKDVSFESPMSPNIFTRQVAPEIDIQLNVEHGQIAEDVYEVVLSVTATARHDSKTVFLCEVQQGGVFVIQGVGPAEREMVLEIACPNILLPFVRETVAGMVAKGGFPQLLINPVNFEAVYHQKRQGGEAGATATAESVPPQA
jgi:preprotein translocase subunit SecB